MDSATSNKSRKSSKAKVAKWRASLSEDERNKIRSKHAQLMQNQRANQTNEEKLLDKERKAKKRAALTEKEKSRQREKDRLRKAAKKTPAPANWRTLPRKGKKHPVPYTEPERNRMYQEKRRLGRTEFERIENLLIKRNTRANRSEEEKRNKIP